MFRRWLSSFWKRNKGKVYKYAKICGEIILVAYMVFMVISAISKNKTSNTYEDEAKKVYRPTKTIASGKNLSKEDYEEEKNLVDVFLDYCNNSNPEEAYELLTDYCKEELYPDLETFKTLYYDNIFTEKRVYSLQSWVVKDNYHTYMIRFSNDAMSTGVYNKNDVYQDYITICEENGDKKISIGKYVKFEKLDITSGTDSIVVKITGKKVFMDYVVYTLEVENKTGETISLDPYENLTNTQIVMDNKVEYSLNWNELNPDKLIIKNGQNRELEFKFNIPYGITSIPKYLKMLKVVLDYEEYNQLEIYQERVEYDNSLELSIKL